MPHDPEPHDPSGHDHDHGDHHHPHPHQKDHPAAVWERREAAIRSLLIKKGVFTAEQIHRKIEEIDHKSAADGARVIAHAWTDPAYEARLLADGNAATAELGLDTTGPKIVALRNTAKVHHLVVCTLCSCCPRMLLGLPPAWYKSAAYRSRAVSEPRQVLAEFGTKLPAEVELRVVDSTADCRYLVVPMRPAGTEGWDEKRLANLITRDSMIGVAPALSPGAGGRA
jgi:nitrile hydratase alpha subunit